MERENKLISGSIGLSLFKLSIPIMATSFLQMAYNMTDMFWVGKLGSGALASVGTVGFYTWFAMGIIFIPKIAAEVNVAQFVGKSDHDSVDSYISNSMYLSIVLGIIYFMVLNIFPEQLIGFFNISEKSVIADAKSYMKIIALGIVPFFMNPVLTAIYNGYGDSKTPFAFNAVGLVLNMVLDPLLIFGFDSNIWFGIEGAGFATIISQWAVTAIFIGFALKKKHIIRKTHFSSKPDLKCIKRIFKIGLPASVQSALFTIFAMLIARIVGKWGAEAIAVQRVGSQIEAISWMTASGFATAISTFTGQNYGAGKMDRVNRGYLVGMLMVCSIGLFANIAFLIWPQHIFGVFSKEEYMLLEGMNYLKILSYSQLFMCMEIGTSGAFNGLGKTMPPSIVGVSLNAVRIPIALLLSASIGISGVWWALSATGILKGVVLLFWFLQVLKKMNHQIEHMSSVGAVR